jgi:NADH-quinone oxidoreductase subunit G
MAEKPEFINFTIDGHPGRALKGTLIIAAAERMGIYIPRFCHHEKMVPYAGCRMCLVEVEGMPKLIASCSTTIQDNMVIHTDTEKVKKNQQAVLEFLLINHPLDCPICDKGGECPLQNQYYEFSSSLSRFTEDKLFKSHAPLNPTIEQDFNRCVLCKRCVRFTYEVAPDDLIVYSKRAVHTEVASFDRRSYESVYSGNIIELCPVGALTDNIFRFRCRPWELNHKDSVCLNCSQNCHIDLQYRSGELMRIFSRSFDPINECWICDRGRFNHQWLNSNERIRHPMEKVDGKWQQVTWKRALELIVGNIQKTLERDGTGAIAGVIDNDHTLEELLAFRKLMWDTIKTPHFDSYPGSKGLRTEKGDYFLRNLPTYEQVAGSDAVLNIGCDLVSEAPMLAVKMRKYMIHNRMKPFNLVIVPSSTDKLMPEIVIPLENYASILAEIVRRLTLHPKIDDSTRNRILESLANIPLPLNKEFTPVIEAIDSMIKSRKVSLLIGRWILKRDSVYLSLVKILIELFERTQAIPVIMPVLEGGNAVGAELMKVHPMLSSAGATGEMMSAGGQGSDDVINAALHGRIKILIIFSHRFGMNLPKYEWERGTEKVDYMIRADYFLTPLSESADLILPLQSQYEKNGYVVNNEGRFDRISRALKLKGDSISTLDIIAKVARGLGNTSSFDQDTLIGEIMSDERFGDQLSPGGFIFTGTKRQYIERLGILKPAALPEKSSEFPFTLVIHQPFWYGDAAIIKSPDVSKRFDEFTLTMNHTDAEEHNFKIDQTVQISTEHGSIKAILRVDERVPKGYVILPEGYLMHRLGVLNPGEKGFMRVRVGPSYSTEENVSLD